MSLVSFLFFSLDIDSHTNKQRGTDQLSQVFLLAKGQIHLHGYWAHILGPPESQQGNPSPKSSQVTHNCFLKAQHPNSSWNSYVHFAGEKGQSFPLLLKGLSIHASPKLYSKSSWPFPWLYHAQTPAYHPGTQRGFSHLWKLTCEWEALLCPW